jgi:hypothetical protein
VYLHFSSSSGRLSYSIYQAHGGIKGLVCWSKLMYSLRVLKGLWSGLITNID